MKIETHVNMSMKGRFKIWKGREGGARVKVAEFDNLILDGGLNGLGTIAQVARCWVGTGTSTPTITQTALDTPIAKGTLSNSAGSGGSTFVDGTEPYVQGLLKCRFEQGAAVGNISEIGVSSLVDGAPLFSRALVEDTAGVPTTITVKSDEYLDIEYTIMIYPPTTDTTGTAVISGVTYDWKCRACQINSAGRWNGVAANVVYMRIARAGFYSGSIGSIYEIPSGTSTQTSNTSPIAYQNNSLQATGTINAGLNDANVAGGIKSIFFSFGSSNVTLCTFQLEFNNKLQKDNTKSMSLVVGVNWGRK